MDPAECPLTARQLEAYERFIQGDTIPRAANQMHISVTAYRTHLRRGRYRLGAPDNQAAANILIDSGWITGNPPHRPISFADEFDRHFHRYLFSDRGERDELLMRERTLEAADALLDEPTNPERG